MQIAWSFQILREGSKVSRVQCVLRRVAIFLGLAGSTAMAAPPEHYPDFSRESAAPMVVVATVKPGKELPQFAECAQPTVVCVDPPPFWFEASIRSVVHGKRLPRRVNVVTTDHFGIAQYEQYKSLSLLILLLSDGKKFVMPRYAMEEVNKDKHGHFYLPVMSPLPTHWLPCSVAGLRERVDFGDDMAVTQDSDEKLEDPDLYRITDKGAVPIYGISLTRLAAHLDSLTPTAAQMRCETPIEEGRHVE